MPSLPELQISLPRWIGIFRQQGEHSDNHLEDGSGGGGVEEETSAAVSESSPVECYACTQVGVPPFHSTSCDHAHPPEWEASAGSSLIPIQYQNPRGSATTRGGSGSGVGESKFNRRMSIKGPWGRVLDPRSKLVQRWNRAFLITRGVALAVDPLFFYSLSIGRDGAPCLYMDGGLAAIVTVLRTLVDAFQLFHLCLQLRLAYVSKESLVVGCGKLVWDASAIASHYLHSLKGFWFDVFVILPIPQMIFWLVVPQLIREEKIRLIMTVLLFMFLFQFLPKVYHSICIMKRMQKVTGYIFGTIWWGFALNLIAYFIASHVAGGCWYVLTIQRVASCLGSQCDRGKKCRVLACSNEVCYRLPLLVDVIDQCSNNSTMATNGIPNVPVCLNGHGPFPYGIYKSALPIVASNSIVVKILYPIFWGLMTLSTFGNDLEPTSHWLEVIFSIIVVLSGLMLFTLLIGNIQVFLHAVMARKRKMQLRCRDLEWWMRRRQLPSRLRQRVRHFERHRWAAMGGEDEMDLIKDLPEGLRRDIKRYLCVDLIRKVPLFQNLDDLILDNICDRVKPLVFSKDEKIIREGDPVQRMVFVVNGQLSSNQKLSKGIVATCTLGPGSFLGDELLSWCLRRPFIDRLPASSATFVCIEPTEAFGLDAHSLRFITEHFRYKFANERLKRTARYYSSNWRTWAAVNVQLAWRRYIKRTRGPMIQGIENGNGNGNGNGDSDRLLMRYAALFMSLRPHDHLE